MKRRIEYSSEFPASPIKPQTACFWPRSPPYQQCRSPGSRARGCRREGRPSPEIQARPPGRPHPPRIPGPSGLTGSIRVSSVAVGRRQRLPLSGPRRRPGAAGPGYGGCASYYTRHWHSINSITGSTLARAARPPLLERFFYSFLGVSHACNHYPFYAYRLKVANNHQTILCRDTARRRAFQIRTTNSREKKSDFGTCVATGPRKEKQIIPGSRFGAPDWPRGAGLG